MVSIGRWSKSTEMIVIQIVLTLRTQYVGKCSECLTFILLPPDIVGNWKCCRLPHDIGYDVRRSPVQVLDFLSTNIIRLPDLLSRCCSIQAAIMSVDSMMACVLSKSIGVWETIPCGHNARVAATCSKYMEVQWGVATMPLVPTEQFYPQTALYIFHEFSHHFLRLCSKDFTCFVDKISNVYTPSGRSRS